MTSLMRAMWSWIRSLFAKRDTAFRIEHLDDDPSRLSNSRLYVIGDRDHPWKAMLKCPCGCGEIIELNLCPPARPRWTVSVEGDHRPTVKPSIWRTTGCRSHFVLRRGLVHWCLEQIPHA